ncbi:hypothetical protein FH972_014802 [Carpinus fangiana]|uniref:Uncharacterized protein n=1 Tax=Carpinus fangiana TaxID=176857 RepID=A0A5N6RAN4_9ROSI|nr:hypothetical protein FH972_014802 [Carpinus fangiana]
MAMEETHSCGIPWLAMGLPPPWLWPRTHGHGSVVLFFFRFFFSNEFRNTSDGVGST